MDQGLGQAGTGLLVVNVHGTVLRCHHGICMLSALSLSRGLVVGLLERPERTVWFSHSRHRLRNASE